MNKALITFAKAPVPGTVKTRLQADIGAEKAVSVYRSFVTAIITQCARLKGIDRFLGCAPSKNHEFLKNLADRNHMKTFNQRGETLGERIFNAFQYCGKKGYSEIVLIGTDSPSIPMNIIRNAFSQLERNDLVIGPCFDRGFYLIGTRREKIREFSGTVEIDTGNDVDMILKKADQMKMRLHMLPFWYDIDDVHDLEFLKVHMTYLNKSLPSDS